MSLREVAEGRQWLRRHICRVARIPLAMLWTFALIALLSAVFTIATVPGIVVLDRWFTWVGFFLYVVSAVGGFCYHVVYPRAFGAKPF